MNILVCVKQVPDTTEIRIDPVNKTLIRNGVPSIVNPYDTYALENAARIKDADPSSKIYVISMGPEQAKAALRECLSIAADKAYLITDRVFGGSDTLATSYIISSAIKYVEQKEGIRIDAVFCGKQAIDGDTAQVGPEIAEHLGYPQITYALDAEAYSSGLKVTQEADSCRKVVTVTLPAVVTFTKPDFPVRYANARRILAANRTEIENITAEKLAGIDLARCGLKGSPTKVKSTFVPVHETKIQWIDETTPSGSGVKLASVLREEHLI